MPLEYNKKERRFNWQLIFCELYAGGKYNNNDGENYEYSLGLNGLGACATQYSSEYMNVVVHREDKAFKLYFEKGKNKQKGLHVDEDVQYEHTGTTIHWKPDLAVFTEINIPIEYYQDVIRKQAIVNAGLKFI